ncbi:MAG: cytochrome c oxidase subunit II [Pseudomonadota bacterium]
MLKHQAWVRGIAGAVLALCANVAWAYTTTGNGWNIPVGVTEISREVHGLNTLIFWVCVGIGVAVFGVMFYSVFAHRKSRHPKPADFHESITVEIAWTIVPFIILIAMAIPAARVLIRMDDTRAADISIKVTGYQWKWEYEYLDQGVKYFSTLSAQSNEARQLHSGIDVTKVPNYLVDVDNALVLPVGKKVRFLITANDVIHAWWVPDLSVKKDAIPGYINETWATIEVPGTYRGVCAELCGRDHGFMPIVVQALPESEYNAWLAKAKSGKIEVAAAPATVMSDAQPTQLAAAAEPAKAAPADGAKIYAANCAACHQPEGQGMPPNFPALKGSKIANGPAAEHIKQTLKGKNLMPPFNYLSDENLAAVLTYERTSWGNKGGAVTPAQVAAARK